jgi:2-oxoglutarate ferredoxin oxidoreductase subunit alpha
MKKKTLMKGNEAIAKAAIEAGCDFFYGYPITPSSEIPEYLEKHLPQQGGKFLQLSSEIAAINRVYGASCGGARVMTASSSPGISLKQEGISYLACAELPAVIINIMRGGPGLGGIQPSQADYFQTVKGGGHGDYRLIVLAPASVQEAADLTMLAFDLADKYRNPVMILGDGALGQMMEPIEFKKRPKIKLPPKDWALTGAKNREPRQIVPFSLDPAELERINLKLAEKYKRIEKKEVRYEAFNLEKPDIVAVGYGLVARILQTVARNAQKEGIEIGLIRPITLWPFPSKIISEVAGTTKKIITVEMSLGQMVEDVRLAVNGKAEVYFYGRTGGMVPGAQEILNEIKRILGG